MRTNIDLDETLIREAMETLGQKTKKGAIEQALRMAVQLGRQKKAFDRLYGAGWYGDLEEIRGGWSPGEAAE